MNGHAVGSVRGASFVMVNWCRIKDFERAGKHFVTCRSSESRLPFFYANCENRQVTYEHMKPEDLCWIVCV